MHYAIKSWMSAVAALPFFLSATNATRAATITLIPVGSTWKYLDNGTDQGTAWSGPGFNDASWASGPAQLGYGDGDEATVVSFGPSASNKYITTYFRRTFNLSNPASVTNLSFSLLRDDGGVVYLNGTEIFRSPNMPAGPIAFNTTTMGTAPPDNTVDQATVNSALGLLVAGANVIAVEIHQQAVTSSDISFDFQLIGIDTAAANVPPTVSMAAPTNNSMFNAPTNVLLQANANDTDGSVSRVEFFRDSIKIGEDTTGPAWTLNWTNALVSTFQLTAVATDNEGASTLSAPISVTFTGAAPVTLIANGSVWKYLDNGTDQGTAWTGIGFDDNLWASGPAQLGYGDGDEATVVSFGPDPNNKYITTYFRRAFTVADPTAYSFLTLHLRRDDGVVVYLNGTEVLRDNFPAGTTTITFNTFASIAGDDGNAVFTNNVPSNLLVAGPNVVAVEVHQANPGSSDISFELELVGNTGAIVNNPPTVSISAPPNNATFIELANLTIDASAFDSDGSVTKVEFFVNGSKVGEDTSAPYSFGWNGVPAGNYALTAIATDNLGATATSSAVNVFVVASTAPMLASKTPAPGTLNSLTQIVVQFSEPVDGVDASDLLINNVPASSVTGSSATYTFGFPEPPEGGVAVGFASNHGIVDRESPPKPFDATAPAASWTYTLVDNVAPTVVKIDPIPGATTRSLSSINVTFSEPVGGINPTDLRINGRGANSVNGFGAGPYKFSFTQPTTNGAVNVGWTNNHGIHDLSAAMNAFAGGSWTYTLQTNVIETNIVLNEIMYHPFHNDVAFVPEPVGEEYIELYNRGTNAVNLTGWKLKGGVDFTFLSNNLAAGAYLVVAANTSAFSAKYPGVTNVVGNWTGRLSDRDNDLNLEDALGQQIDSVHYADEGDWALRRVLPDAVSGRPSWEWTSEADGQGKSLELINPRMPNQYGQNWAASIASNGTPGRTNSVLATNIPPLILDVAHAPAVPRTTNSVTISARLLDELTTGLSATLFWRLGTGNFTQATMFDDGAHNDGLANDRVFAAILPAQTNLAVVEFYVRASDSGNRTRTWPAPTDANGTQGANALFQFDNEVYTGSQPIYRIIMTEADNQALADLNNTDPRSDARVNGSFVTIDGTETRIVYQIGVRLRGAGSRGAQPPNLRLQFPTDHKWKGRSAINLNTLYTHSQLVGSILSRKAGLTSEEAIAVQVRRGGTNAASANSPQFGSHIFLETRDSDWAENHFPLDPNGNLYTATRPNAGLFPINPPTPANLEANGYQKDTNKSDNDYNDVVTLLNVLNNTPDAQYPSAVREVVNAEIWLRYMAVLSLLGYGETALGSDGAPDDYTLYRGLIDTRFHFLPHDHDTDMGQGDGSRRPPTDSIFRAGDGNPVVNRFQRHPEFVPLYYQELKFQLEHTFSLAQWTRTLDQAFANFPVNSQTIFDMKVWMTNRYFNVWSQIPTNLVINPPALSQQNGYYQTTTASVALSGLADVVNTRFVKVNGQFATWVAAGGTWSITINLPPGINRVIVQTTNAGGRVLQEGSVEIWFDDGTVQNVSGAIAADTTWTAAGGPYNVTANLTVNAGATLTIQPGTTVYLGAGVNIAVANGGRIVAEGTDGARIRFTRAPGTATSWGGITINGGASSPETRIAYAHFEFNGATAIHSADGTVYLDHLTFGNTAQQYVSLDGSSFVVSHCVFPTATAQFELVHGTGGIKSAGRGLFLRNFFGVPIGYNDVVDFTGGNRPGQPIVQFIDNVFTGATDDILDLDGTDAWIQGNIFLHSHKNGSPDSSSAISGGLTGSDRSEITIIGNLIYDVDQAANAKEGNFYTLINNAIVRQNHSGGTDTNGTVALLADVGTAEGAGMYFEGNIIYDAEKLVFGRTNSVVTFTNNIITLLQGAPWSGPGGNNTNVDPAFKHVPQLSETTGFTSWEQAQVMWDWFSLRPGSPASGTGPNGLDKGGVIPSGASISGEPAGTTPLTGATLTVGVNRTGNGIPTSGFPDGSGFTHYRWRLDGGAWSAETPITTPISLSGLTSGPHRVDVSGKLDSGFYQDDALFSEDARVTSSRTWFVNAGASTLRINEVLARNDSAVPVGLKFPDLIELYNDGPSPVSLAGVGVTDEADNPFKFSFPAGATLGAGQYLILYADNDATPAGYHLGFSLKQEGDEVFLTAPDGRTLDSVKFGLQVPDRSIGRRADGSWVLCQPAFGAANVPTRIGDPTTLKINEWLASGQTPYPDDFIELYNPDPLPVSLGELFLTDMPTGAPFLHDITPLSFIPGGGYAVFIADGNASAGADHVNFRLGAENGLIALIAADGSVIDCVFYGPQTTDVSMGRQPNGVLNYGFFSPPTPGAPNPAIIPPGGTVTINEVLAQNTIKRAPDNTTPDWVELYNPTGSAIDLSDMSLTDDVAQPRRYVFANGTIIPALGFFTIRCDADIPAGSTNTGFGLKQTGQALYLFDKLANGGGQLSSVSFGVQAADFSIGRVPDGSTNWVLCAEKIGLPNVAAALGGAANLKVNEWMANPSPGDDDWFEIFNPNAQPVALGGLHLSDNLGTPASRMKHQIAPLSFIGIGGWAYQKFVADNNLAGGPDHVNFALSTGGEQIGISAANGTLIDGTSFGAQAENVSQGRLPDGNASIVSFIGTASPGDPNYLLLSDVIVSEALSHTDVPLEDAIELQNVSGVPVNIGGWYLSNAKHDLRRFRIPNGTTLQPGGFQVFYQYQFGETNENAPAVPPLFNLDSAHGDEVYLAQATNDVFTGYRSQVSFGPAENGVSFGRYVTSVGPDFTAMSARTFGADTPDSLSEFRMGTGRSNAYPRVGPIVITEIMYHPIDTGTNDNVLDEFIELQNISGASVPLYDPVNTTNTWKLKDAVTFSFPPNTSIPANGFLIVVSFDPTNTAQLNAFRSKYNMQAGTPIVGPYSGKLDNGGESVELAKPDAPQTIPGPDFGFVPYILVDKVKYSDAAPWPSCGANCGPDGGGQSLQRINLNEYGNDPINWLAGSPTPGPQGSSLDTDNDGMPDSWEQQYGLIVGVNDSQGDLDGDGLKNIDEYLVGTAPNDPNSTLRLRVSLGAGAVLQFNAAAGISYIIEYKSALASGPWTFLFNVPAGSARPIQFTDASPGTLRFYRVRTQ
jgi:hypothetical protein